ncbi:MAG TPA: hypothetical protein VNT32_12545 [Thermoleophilaceae bacterium]|nr:hypothetical protein [Thermoleophilaceae bacterium]
MSALDRMIDELRESAERLRGGIEAEEAAALVERCAELATDIGSELDRQARDARSESPPGQESLLG